MTVAISNKTNDPLGASTVIRAVKSSDTLRFRHIPSVTSQHPCVIIRTASLNAELLVSLQKNFTAVAKIDNNSSNPPGHRSPLTYAYRPAQYTDKLSLCFTVLEFSPFYVPIETCQSFISTPLSAYSWSNSRQIFGLTAVDFPIVVLSAEKVWATSKRESSPIFSQASSSRTAAISTDVYPSFQSVRSVAVSTSLLSITDDSQKPG
jgi:hypothetical protein